MLSKTVNLMVFTRITTKEQRKNFSCGRNALASKQRLISKTRLINLRLTYTKGMVKINRLHTTLLAMKTILLICKYK